MEVEENETLPFLDVDVRRENNHLTTGVYRKPTHTDRLLDYGSFHPTCHKKSVIKTLWKRAQRNCSSETVLKKEKDYLFNVFHKNNYPSNKFKQWIQDIPNQENFDYNKFIPVPYIKGPSEAAARVLKEGKVYVAHKPSNTLKMQLTKIKDQRPSKEKTGVVYSIPCHDCPLTYVGQSGRKFGTRMKEHKKAVEKSDRLSNIFSHENESGHHMNIEGASILYSSRRWNQRLFLEAWATNDGTLNRSIDINPVYDAIR